MTTETTTSAFVFGGGWQDEVVLPAFAVSFVFVTFSYSGWNAAAYIVEEIRDPRRNLPIALVSGTVLVSLLYLALNFVFLKHNTLEELKGTLEIGRVTAIAIFGDSGGKLISFGIAFLLVSSISAMVWAGPRVTQAMGEDHRLWKWFAYKTKRQIPVRALWLQTAITIALLLSGTFEQVMVYSGFVLQMFSALAVAAVLATRRQKKAAGVFKSPLYPLPQILYLILSLWIMIYLAIAQPVETGLGILNLIIGMAVFFLGNTRKK
jgi:APA family basic amino acid/polyamine antiporter